MDDEAPLSSMKLAAFSDAEPALAEIKAHGYSIAVVSNTFQSDAKDVTNALETLGLLQYIDTVVTSVDVGEEKPHSRVFQKALDSMGLSASEVAMVGDDIIKDIDGAHKLGIITIFVNRSKDLLEVDKPTFVVSTLREILPILETIQINQREPSENIDSAPSFSEDEYGHLSQMIEDAQSRLDWDEASHMHIKAAEYCLTHNNYEKAASHLMRAARCREQNEDWREIGTLWLRAARALEQVEQPTESLTPYEDYDASQHFFLGIAPELWDELPIEERIGRAYRYSGYHLEKGGINQSAYNQYYRAGLVFEASKDWEKANRAFYLAMLSFIRQFGEINREYLGHLENSNQQCLSQDEIKFLNRARLYYRIIGAELRRQGNKDDEEEVMVKQENISRRIAYKNRRTGQFILYSLWKITSNYGTDFRRWLGWTITLSIGVFPVLYTAFDVLVPKPSGWLDAVYFSVAAFVTLSYLDFAPVGWGRLIALSEMIIGLLMLGSLVTLVVNKIMR